MKAFMLIVTRAGNEENVVDALRSLPPAVEVHRLYGDYDIIAKIETGNLRELLNLTNELLRKRGILHIETLIVEGDEIERRRSQENNDESFCKYGAEIWFK